MTEPFWSEDIIMCRCYQVNGFDKACDLGNMIDESEVEHQISSHKDTLPDSYRQLAGLVRNLTSALQAQQDLINKMDYKAVASGSYPTEVKANIYSGRVDITIDYSKIKMYLAFSNNRLEADNLKTSIFNSNKISLLKMIDFGRDLSQKIASSFEEAENNI